MTSKNKKSEAKLDAPQKPRKKLGQKLRKTKQVELTLESAVIADIIAGYLYAISAVDDNKEIVNLTISPLGKKYQVSFTEEVK